MDISCLLDAPDHLGLFAELVVQRLDGVPELLFLGVGEQGHFHAPGPQVGFGLGFPLGPEAALQLGAFPRAFLHDGREGGIQRGQFFLRGPAGDLDLRHAGVLVLQKIGCHLIVVKFTRSYSLE